MSERMTVRAAAKLIYPGTIKDVRFMFVSHDGNVGWLRVPKVEAKRMLRDLYPGSTVRVDLHAPTAYIIGQGSLRTPSEPPVRIASESQNKTAGESNG